MAILLVKQSDNPVPDSPGKWRQGEIVGVFADDHVFGGAEVPAAGNFYRINVTDRTVAEVESYLQAWRHEPSSNIDATNGTGGFRITITSTMVSASGANAITRSQMDAFIEKWNGVYHAHTNTTYTFDITTYKAATSEGFWGVDPAGAGVVFADEGFAGDVQQVQLVNPGPFAPAQIAQTVERLGGTVIDSDSFTIPSSTLYDGFKDDIEEAWRQISYRRRRWRINPAGLAILAGGTGELSAPAATVANYLLDGLTE